MNTSTFKYYDRKTHWVHVFIIFAYSIIRSFILKIATIKKWTVQKQTADIYILQTQKSLKSIKELSSHAKLLTADIKKGKSSHRVFVQDSGAQVALIYFVDKSLSDAENLESLRQKASVLYGKLKAENFGNVRIHNGSDVLSQQQMIALVEGLILRDYRFDKYKKEKVKYGIKSLQVLSDVSQASWKELLEVTKATNAARTLVNEPVNFLTARRLSAEIKKLSKTAGFNVTVFSKAKIEALKMGGLLGVNKGSSEPPTFNILEWKPRNAKNKKPIILVGKGVVYDTGGYNIKPGAYMQTMKADMGGAAAVVGTLTAVASNKLPLHVLGLIPATDNRVNSDAYVADDILKMYDGTTVEVLNTDAEGRLILADALAYAKKYKPELVIDLATLTGAAAAITGSFGSAMMGTADEKRKNELKNSGDEVHERLAEMPFWKDYEELLNSKVADMTNLGGPVGGAITAGKFLQHFTDYPWIHLDIAGPAHIKKEEGYRRAGGTGVGVRLLYNFLKKFK